MWGVGCHFCDTFETDISFLAYRTYVILKPEFAFPLSYYLIPFIGVVVMIILVMVVIMVSVYDLTSPWIFYTVSIIILHISSKCMLVS